jgi:hypothetical protein
VTEIVDTQLQTLQGKRGGIAAQLRRDFFWCLAEPKHGEPRHFSSSETPVIGLDRGAYASRAQLSNAPGRLLPNPDKQLVSG